MLNNLIPFHLPKAIAGEKLITGKGEHVTEFHRLETLDSPCKNVVVINGKAYGASDMGVINESSPEPITLFMAPNIIIRWQNVHIGFILSPFYNTKEEADEACIVANISMRPSNPQPNPRTDYLKSYWTEENIIQSVELIPFIQ